MTTYRRKELTQAWVLFMLIGILFDWFIPMAWVHEFGHAMAAVFSGVRVYSVRATLTTTAFTRSAFIMYAGPAFAIAVWLTVMIYLLRSRRSLVIAAFVHGRAIGEWFFWWVSGDRHNIDRLARQWSAFVDGFHVVVTLSAIIACSIVALTLVKRWDKQAPRHLDNPALFKQGHLSPY